MNTTIHELRFTDHMTGVSDGTVAGTHFYNEENGAEIVPADVTVQQEGLHSVRIRFASRYGIGSFVMGPDDTMSINKD